MIKLLLVPFLLLFLSACGSEKDNSEPPAELTDFESSIRVEKLWDISIGDGVEQQYLKLYPLVLDDRVIVADREGEVVAISLEDGDELWSVELDLNVSGGVSGNDQYLFVTTRDGGVVKLDQIGKLLWHSKVSSEVLVPPVVTDGKVIVRSVDGQITALDVATGKEAWTYKRDVPALSLRGNSIPLVDHGRIYNGLDNGRLVVLAENDGRTLFDVAVTVPAGRSELERMVDIDGDVALDDAVLYVAAYQGRIVAIDVRRGQLIWTRNLSTYTGIEIDSSSLFISDVHDYLWAMDKNNGATLWKQEKLKARQLTRPTRMGEWLVVGDFEGYLHWISQYDGRFVARVELDDSGILVPPVVKNNRLFAISRDGVLAAYQIQSDK